MKKNSITMTVMIFFFILLRANATLVVIAPHPDDAESSCGGLIANTTARGERVVILTMTGGEIGLSGKTIQETYDIRKKEAERGAKILDAELLYFGGMDGSLAVDNANTEKLKKVLESINPDVVVAPWMLDVHPDHQATSVLAWRIFMDKALHFQLYFYETANEPHTKSIQFYPTNYVNISKVLEVKKKAVLQHQCQGADQWYKQYEIMATFRGYEADVNAAEAYVKAQNSSGMGGRQAKYSYCLDNSPDI
ncbi:MAG: family deacetylase [Bacteroidetes bacterium]|nr:family deacetylase [Bacteroidota bacterium]